HAKPYRSRRVHVTARESPAEAVYVIRDEGPGFDPSKLPDPTDPANLERVTGRGLLLIRTFMDEVHHNPKGNEITMVNRADVGAASENPRYEPTRSAARLPGSPRLEQRLPPLVDDVRLPAGRFHRLLGALAVLVFLRREAGHERREFRRQRLRPVRQEIDEAAAQDVQVLQLQVAAAPDVVAGAAHLHQLRGPAAFVRRRRGGVG